MTHTAPPDAWDASRDALALVRASMADDQQAIKTILQNTDLRLLATTLAGLVHGALDQAVEALGVTDPAERRELIDENLVRMMRHEET